MGTIKQGAFNAVNNCAKIKKGEKVVIITDLETKEIAELIKKEAEKTSGEEATFFVMEDFGERPEDGSNPLKLPQKIIGALEKSDVSFYLAKSKKGEAVTFRRPIMEFVRDHNHLRHAHMPNITNEIMKIGMCTDYDKIKQITHKITKILEAAKIIKATTPSGTNIIARFSPKIKWVPRDGDVSNPGELRNLPDGEVYTCVDIINGIYVVDGVIGDHFCEKYGLLKNNPIILTIKDSRVTNVDCENKELKSELLEYLKQDENSNRIGEFALGTNIFLKEFIGVMLQDEKFPGMHIAIGHGYPKTTGSNWTSKAHADCVVIKPTIEVDGKIIMKDGKYLI